MGDYPLDYESGVVMWAYGVPGVAALEAVAVFLLASCASWLFWGWEPGDRSRVLRSLVRSVGRECELLTRALGSVASRIAQMVEGRSRASPRVSLGMVSEMIDIVRLGLSAGLSFDAALALYCEGSEGVLAARLKRAQLMWQTGVSMRESELLAVADDMGVRALESFAVAVGQALELGAPLAETLDNQSREIRAAHRAEVERQIERAPVKLLIPTGTLILPALLLSILGPLLAAGGML